MDRDLRRLEGRLGYHFRERELLRRALTHRSAGAVNNERLEFLGDAVLDLLTADLLFERLPAATEGDLTRLRSSLVKGKTLAKVAAELELGECLSLGGGEMKSGGHRRESILSDALEAIFGAIYLESGLDVCRERMLAWFHSRLDEISLEVNDKDAKTRLQEYLQGRGLPRPVYEVVATEGDDHNQTITVVCKVSGMDAPVTASATSRKAAEKQSAQLALAHLLDHES